MSSSEYLSVYAQLLLSNDAGVVDTACHLIKNLVEYNLQANSKLYLTGVFFFGCRCTLLFDSDFGFDFISFRIFCLIISFLISHPLIGLSFLVWLHFSSLPFCLNPFLFSEKCHILTVFNPFHFVAPHAPTSRCQRLLYGVLCVNRWSMYTKDTPATTSTPWHSFFTCRIWYRASTTRQTALQESSLFPGNPSLATSYPLRSSISWRTTARNASPPSLQASSIPQKSYGALPIARIAWI